MNISDKAILLTAGYIIITIAVTLMIYQISFLIITPIFAIALIPLYVLIRSDETIF